MNKITISISALFLAMGVLSGCGEKKEEAPKAEAPKAEAPAAKQEGMSGMSGMAAQQEGMSGMAGKQEGMSGMSGMSAEQAGMSGMSGMAAQQAGMSGMSGMAAQQEGMSGMSGMAGKQEGMSGMSGMAAEQAGMSGMSGMAAQQAGMSGMSGMAGAGGKPDGEKVYKGLCFSCHDAGVAGAPKLGDKAAWAPRIATGMDALHNSSLKGKNAMPAKGGNPALPDADVMAAVDWMVSKAK